jgi:hypothetical protein
MRCTGWPKANDLQLAHGTYSSPVKLQPETDALAAELVELVPMATAADGPAIQLLALALVRIGKAEAGVRAAEEAGADPATTERLEERARRWTGTATKLLDALGMTPTARARLAKDAAASVASQAVLDDLVTRGRELRLGRTAPLDSERRRT